MNRKFLQEQGLEQEQIDAVMRMYGKSVKDYQSELNDVEKERDELKSKIDANDNSDEVEKLKAKVEKLEETNVSLNSSIKEYKSQLVSNELDKEIIKRVSRDAHDADDIFKFIEKDKFEFDEETNTYTNIDEVLESLREEKPYLFNSTEAKNDGQEGDEGDEGDKSYRYKSSSQQGNKKAKKDFDEIGKQLAKDLFA